MKVTFTILIALLFIQAVAQQKPPAVVAAMEKFPTDTTENSKQPLTGNSVFVKAKAAQYANPISVQIEAGTTGAGADFRYGFLPNLSGRLGATFAPVTANYNFSFSGFTTNSTENVNFVNVHLLADFVPFAGAPGFRIVGGAGYFAHATGHVVVTPTGNYTIANYNLTGSQIGILDMDVTWKGIAPYLGIGLFKSFPSKFFNFNLDLGTYYLTAPTTHITGTNLLVDNNQLEPQFNDNLKDYRWLPVLQFNFNFRLQ